MRLAALISELGDDELERFEAEHVGEGEHVARDVLVSTLETVLRSYSFVKKFVGDRSPPTFSMLEVLLDAEGHAVPIAGFREEVEEKTNRIIDRVRSGDLVARDDSLRVYRRVFFEARRNDHVLDASETAILGVLRQELNIRTVEHFLIEHHDDFKEFAQTFFHEQMALRSCGVIFPHQGKIVLAEDVAPLVRKVLGIEMPSDNRGRLFEQFTGSDLADVLEGCGLKTSGSRDEKLSRLMLSYVQPSEALRYLTHGRLKDICRDANAAVSGSKDELADRLVHHFLHAFDVAPPPGNDVAAPDPEPRSLEESRFRELLGALRGDDLSDILAGIESSRITGGKETKIDLLIRAPFSETTLLENLTSKALEEVLYRERLRTAGSKRERIQRLIDHFRSQNAMSSTEANALMDEPRSATPGNLSASDSALIDAVCKVLGPNDLKAREIALQLAPLGFEIDRTTLNSTLYRVKAAVPGLTVSDGVWHFSANYM